MQKFLTAIPALIKREALAQAILARAWGPLPSYTTLRSPVIKPVEVATIVGAAALVFEENGVPKVILAEAGPHYSWTVGKEPLHMFFGGFINLSWTPGSSLVKASQEPEHPRTGVAREIEEEMPGADGQPLLKIDPEKLKLIYVRTLSFGEHAIQLVSGFVMRVPQDKVPKIKDHINGIHLDPDFRQFIADQTSNPETGKPEVAAISIHDLRAAAAGQVPFLYPGQIPFFRRVLADQFQDIAIPNADQAAVFRAGTTSAKKETTPSASHGKTNKAKANFLATWRDLDRRRKLLHMVTARMYGSLPPYSTLKAPQIVDVEAVPVASGTALVFKDSDIMKIILVRAGAHYQETANGKTLYMIPGGFLNLTETPGSSLVAPSSEPESPEIGAARKIEKKLCDADGAPLLQIDPARLIPMDTLTLSPQEKKKQVVVGNMLLLAADEVAQIASHISRAQADPSYRSMASARTANPSSGLPEVAEIGVFDLAQAAGDKLPLLHRDQLSLFRRISEYAV